ncbi:ABC transporter substrate-binding protein [Streptomyces sp. NBC_00637]|uniref:ABC transporter substrate-binding protein n=1 Tax=Streptomyces sp. NBC_00637 TaxID=2903667 RepID=UPI00324CA0BA
MKRLTTPLVRCALILGLLLAPVACGEPGQDKVTIMIPWSEDEFGAFYTVVKNFERANPGIDIEPQVTRALTQQLDAAVAADARPDLAVLPSVGAIAKYRTEGPLQKLDVDTSDYVEPFRGLGMEGDDVYAVPVKADVKSLIWYDTKGPTKVSRSADWDDLRSRHYRWCLGLESGPTSGWPGADWIADILLAEKGVDVYTNWASGAVDRQSKAVWKSEAVREAWTTWGDLVGDAREHAATSPFLDATKGMAGQKCSLSHGALSVMSFDRDQVDEGRYSYVPPADKALQVSADFVGKFTGNTSADKFIAYLAGTPAQQAWVDEPGFALSANRKVTSYAIGTQGEIAGLLRAPGHTLCFSAADAMDPDVSAAFYRAVMEYASGKAEGPLLTALDEVQNALGQVRPESEPPLCHRQSP